MEVQIAVDGRDADIESLDWLRNEPELRGRVRTAAVPTPDGAMGASTELVIQARRHHHGRGGSDLGRPVPLAVCVVHTTSL